MQAPFKSYTGYIGPFKELENVMQGPFIELRKAI